MKRFAPIATLLVLGFGLGLSAQDAGMVVRTSVTYNTQKATLPLTDEQRRQADECDDDRTVPVTQSRTMVEAGKKAGAEIVYVEVPGGSHVNVAAPAFAAMLDFFARQQRHAATQ